MKISHAKTDGQVKQLIQKLWKCSLLLFFGIVCLTRPVKLTLINELYEI